MPGEKLDSMIAIVIKPKALCDTIPVIKYHL